MAKRNNNTRRNGQSGRGGAWKKERASVSLRNQKRPRSNKYSGADQSRKPAAGTRQRVWVGGYTRADGTEVQGYYRSINNDR
jgi:hypothetical protein